MSVFTVSVCLLYWIPIWWTPKNLSQMWPQKYWVEGNNYFHRPAGYSLLTWTVARLLCCEGILLTHIQLVVHLDTEVHFGRHTPYSVDLHFSLELFSTKCSTLPIRFLKFIIFLPALYNLRSLWMAATSFIISNSPFILCRNDFDEGRLHLTIPVVCPQNWCWEPGYQLEFKLLITVL